MLPVLWGENHLNSYAFIKKNKQHTKNDKLVRFVKVKVDTFT